MQSGKNVKRIQEQIVNEINAVAPHLLLVMLPTPQQEIFLAQHRKMLNVRLWFGVGTENTFTEKRKKRQVSARDCWRGVK